MNGFLGKDGVKDDDRMSSNQQREVRERQRVMRKKRIKKQIHQK
jgi:hypothetical protein